MDDATGKESAEQLARSHTPAAIRSRLGERMRHSSPSDFSYGVIDGAVTTFAVVSGVAGALAFGMSWAVGRVASGVGG